MNLKNFFSELKRRNVFKAVLAYLAVAWLLIQIASTLFPAFDAPESSLKTLIYLLGIGLIFWTAFAWIYDLTPEGIKKTQDVDSNEEQYTKTGQRLNRIIIASLLVVIGLLLVNQFFLDDAVPEETAKARTSRTYANSIAILPFTDLSPNADQAYLTDGISEGILDLLTKIPALKVISSNSSFQFRNTEKDIPTIAGELDVNYVLNGTLRMSDSMIRVTTKLIDGRDGTQLWDRSYNKKLDDVFQIQDEIATNAARELELAFSDNQLNAPKTEIEAYRLYLEADHLYHEFTSESMVQADANVRNALRRDSTYAPAWLLLGKITDRRYRNFADIPFEEGQRISLEAVEKAISLDPDYAEAYSLYAVFLSHRNDPVKAREMLAKADALTTTDADVFRNGSSMNFYLGNLEEAIRIQYDALSIDPLDARQYFALGINHYFNREFDEALRYLDRYSYLKPDASMHRVIRSTIYTIQGRDEEAVEEAGKEPAEWGKIFGLCNAYWGAGDRVKSDSILKVMIDKYGNGNGQIIAATYANRKDPDQAFYWLEEQLEVNRASLQEVINWAYFDNIMDDPRWGPFLDKLELPEGHWILSTK